MVHVFDLADHLEATRAYASSSPIEEKRQETVLCRLHMGAIKSPQNAVRAAIVAMPDEAGWHWFRFRICGTQATQEQRINKFIREVKEEFHGAKIRDSRSPGYWDDYVEVWIPGKQAGAKFLKCSIVNSVFIP
jgi:hypothetical protein